MNPLFNARSQLFLEGLKKNLPHALLISGEPGIGLRSAAQWVSGKHNIIPIEPEATKSEAGAITVTMVRGLYEQTRARHTHSQIILVHSAHLMTHNAQSAFLKLLEEPNESTRFILTSHYPEALLPTIRSRTQHIALQALDKEQSRKFAKGLGVTDATKLAQLEFLAQGLPAELTRLINDEVYFNARAAIIHDAREFLQADTYTKLCLIQKYKNNREAALNLIESALVIMRKSISAKPQKTLLTELEQLLEVRQRIAANYNIALQLAWFVL